MLLAQRGRRRDVVALGEDEPEAVEEHRHEVEGQEADELEERRRVGRGLEVVAADEQQQQPWPPTARRTAAGRGGPRWPPRSRLNSTTATCQARCLRRPSWPARNSSSSPTSMVTTRPLTRSGSGTSGRRGQPLGHPGQRGQHEQRARQRGQPADDAGSQRPVCARDQADRPSVEGREVVLGEADLGPQRREEDDLADRVDLGQQHDQAVDPHAHPTRGRHAVLEGADVVEVDVAGLGIAGGLGPGLVAEAGQLLDRVVELAVGVGQLAPGRRSPRTARPASGRRDGAWPAARSRGGSRGR